MDVRVLPRAYAPLALGGSGVRLSAGVAGLVASTPTVVRGVQDMALVADDVRVGGEEASWGNGRTLRAPFPWTVRRQIPRGPAGVGAVRGGGEFRGTLRRFTSGAAWGALAG